MPTKSARQSHTESAWISPMLGNQSHPYSHPQNVLWRLQAALDTLPDAVFFVDHLSLAIIDVNHAACTTLGYTREQLLAMRLPQIAPLVDRRELAAELDTLARQRERGKPLRTVQHSRDGRKQPVQWTISWASQSYGGVFAVVSRLATVSILARWNRYPWIRLRVCRNGDPSIAGWPRPSSRPSDKRVMRSPSFSSTWIISNG